MTSEKYQVGLTSKLMGKINLVLLGTPFFLIMAISDILITDPILGGSSASTVNSAINGFVTAAAIELPRGIRITSVSPTIVQESMTKYKDYFLGYEPVPVKRVALAYSKSVNGHQTGKIYTVS